MKVLIIRFSSIGDIVLTTPVLRCLKQQLPETEIHYCTKINFKSIIENNPNISKIFFFDKNISELITLLQAEKYDLIIDLHNNLRSLIIKLKLGVESRSFLKMNFQKWLLVKFKIDKMNESHVVDRYMKTVAHLGVINDNKGLDYFIPQNDEVNINTFPEIFQQGYTSYAIGGQHDTKKLPLHKMIELCDSITEPLVLLGGKEDYIIANQIIEAVIKTNIHNACGQYSLNQSASIIKQADKVISHDTGLIHIASAFKKNIVAIWGNTVPALGFAPYQTAFVSIQNNEIFCRPCSKLGFKNCPKGHFKCMNDLTFENV